MQTQLCCESDAEAPILVPQLHSCGCSEPVTIIKVAMVLVLFPLLPWCVCFESNNGIAIYGYEFVSIDIEQQL